MIRTEEQQEINYKDIMDLGFKAEAGNCSVYYGHYGYPYTIFNINLTKRIYIEWEQEKRTCTMHRTNKEQYILASSPIVSLDHLKATIKFFKG